jgi:hypothetical protein
MEPLAHSREFEATPSSNASKHCCTRLSMVLPLLEVEKPFPKPFMMRDAAGALKIDTFSNFRLQPLLLSLHHFAIQLQQLFYSASGSSQHHKRTVPQPSPHSLSQHKPSQHSTQPATMQLTILLAVFGLSHQLNGSLALPVDSPPTILVRTRSLDVEAAELPLLP